MHILYNNIDILYIQGVLQGSHLRPLLILIFIYDLPLVIDTNIKMLLFADNAKLYFDITFINDTNSLQFNLNELF